MASKTIWKILACSLFVLSFVFLIIVTYFDSADVILEVSDENIDEVLKKPNPNHDRWVLYRQTSDAKDKVQWVSLKAWKGSVNRTYQGTWPSLSIHCFNGVLSVGIVTGIYFASRHPISTRIQIDWRTEQTQTWNLGEDGQSVYSRNSRELLEELKDSRRFIFEFLPAQRTITERIEFDLEGIDMIYKEIKKHCR